MTGAPKSYAYEDLKSTNDDWELKIITINVPKIFLKVIQKLQDMRIYPSRSEACRVAIKEFITKELNIAMKAQAFIESDDHFVRVPIITADGVEEYKTFKVLREA